MASNCRCDLVVPKIVQQGDAAIEGRRTAGAQEIGKDSPRLRRRGWDGGMGSDPGLRGCSTAAIGCASRGTAAG